MQKYKIIRIRDIAICRQSFSVRQCLFAFVSCSFQFVARYSFSLEQPKLQQVRKAENTSAAGHGLLHANVTIFPHNQKEIQLGKKFSLTKENYFSSQEKIFSQLENFEPYFIKEIQCILVCNIFSLLKVL